jgi:hypothetical protein
MTCLCPNTYLVSFITNNNTKTRKCAHLLNVAATMTTINSSHQLIVAHPLAVASTVFVSFQFPNPIRQHSSMFCLCPMQPKELILNEKYTTNPWLFLSNDQFSCFLHCTHGLSPIAHCDVRTGLRLDILDVFDFVLLRQH